jgi:hypothetical protein
MHSQTATEYLIITAVVIIIAVITVSSLSGTLSLGGDESSVRIFWKSNKPISIQSWTVDRAGTQITFQNTGAMPLRLDSVTIGIATIRLAQPLAVGESYTFYTPAMRELTPTMYRYPLAINYTDLQNQASYTINSSQTVLVGTSAPGTGSLNSPLGNGLIGFYPLDRLIDLSPFNRNMTGGAALNFTSGLRRSITAPGYQGANIQVINVSNFSYNGSLSISFWANFSTWQSGGATVSQVVASIGSGATGFDLEQSNSVLRFNTQYNGTFNSCYRGLNYAGVYTHYTFTFDGANCHYYINTTDVTIYGATPNQPIANVTQSNIQLTIGWNTNGGGALLNGSLDTLMIWNRVLSPSEVQQIYDAGVRQR